eukprot:CCRYP_000135-RB/>CCRYP_000135-RB protein AED:0.20 eAED:0.20 QI:1559/1/1/1/0.5/0.66/3/252/844
MSSESTDILWNESINELKRLVQEERSIEDSKRVTIHDAFRHFAKLYIQYTVLLSNLNKCYELTVQPQKRLDVRSTLVNVICRVINLRHLLVKWAPPNPDVLCKNEAQHPFSWEYTDLSQSLRELNVAPSHLGIDTPSFFKEESSRDHRVRNALVLRLLTDRFGDELPPLEEKQWAVQPSSASGHIEDEACGGGPPDPIERNEEDNKNVTVDKRPELAAIMIQTNIRRHLCRKKVAIERHRIGTFVGMNKNDKELDSLVKNFKDIRRKRKEEQSYCQEKYGQDLTRLKDVVRDEEGFRMQVKLREDRIKWITDHVVSKNVIPESFEGFYVRNETPPEDKDVTGKDAKTKSKDVQVKNPKSKDKATATVEVELLSIVGPPLILESLAESIESYERRWKKRNIGPDRVRSQYHDAELAKSLIIRSEIESELTTEVEEKLLSNLLKIKAIADVDTKKSKSKRDATKGKKCKGKKASGKKEKPLPGSTLPGVKEMEVEEMLKVLIDNGLVCIPAQHVLNDLIGGFEAHLPSIVGKEKYERWVPPDPSTFQLKRSIYDYCILSLGHEQIKSRLRDDEHVRSLLLYGPEGSGKTMMAQAIASEIGALFINLSASTIGDSFGGKEGATKLVHMVFTVAKEKSYSPVVIYLDDCHEFFLGKSKKGGDVDTNANMQRFQKDLLIYKNQALKNEDRVLVIGSTSRPDLADVKLLRWRGTTGKPEKQGFFDRSLYCPRANHIDRSIIWEKYIQRKIATYNCHEKTHRIDYGALALLSNGFSAGEIVSIVDDVLSIDRLKNIGSEPLVENEFIRYLSNQRKPNDDFFLSFTRQITDLESRWKALKLPPKAASSNKKK